MIQFYHVFKAYEARNENYALADITLEIAKGEFVFLTGASGAGKSTFLKLIFGSEKPTAGQIVINGRNVARLKTAALPYLRRNLGIIFQDFKLLPKRNVEENVAIALEVLGQQLSFKEIKKRTQQVLRQVGLAHKANKMPLALSGGEQQRVAIARALVNEPQILLADEPTGNLDAACSLEILQLLNEANLQGTTVILATHDKKLLAGDKRILTLANGRLCAGN